MKRSVSYNNGIPLEDLVVGAIYECRVSKRAVMILHLQGGMNVADESTDALLPLGLVYNPISGNTDYVTVYPHQLKLISQ